MNLETPVKPSLFQQVKDFYERYEKWAPLSFFAAGFLFDIATLGRIDDPVGLIQQALYLILVGAILVLSLRDYQPTHPRIAQVWKFQEEILSFFLGSLLSLYMLFYFKAASAFTSSLFLLILCVLIYINESRAFWKWSRFIPLILFLICLISFCLCLVPIWVGSIGVWTFLGSLILSALLFYPVIYFLNGVIVRLELLKILGGTLAAFVFLYFTAMIPPVPLALKDMALFHELKKENGQYIFSYTRPRWKIWQKGDQHFVARPGDRLHLFIRVFSPGGLKEKLYVRWELEGTGGWIPQDLIPIEISGGREEGFRGFTIKQNYSPGEWRVMIETADKRELGRLYFTVELSNDTAPREFHLQVE